MVFGAEGQEDGQAVRRCDEKAGLDSICVALSGHSNSYCTEKAVILSSLNIALEKQFGFGWCVIEPMWIGNKEGKIRLK